MTTSAVHRRMPRISTTSADATPWPIHTLGKSPFSPGRHGARTTRDRTVQALAVHPPDLAAGAAAITVARATASGRGRDRASLPLLDAGAVAGPGRTRRAGLALARGAVRGAAGTGARAAAQVAAGVAAGDARRGAEAGRARALAAAAATAALAGVAATAALAGGERLACETKAEAGDAGRAGQAEREAGDPGDEELAHGRPPFADENRRTCAGAAAASSGQTLRAG